MGRYSNSIYTCICSNICNYTIYNENCKKVGAIDIPKDERRAHKKAIPKFGGPAVILGFLISTTIFTNSNEYGKFNKFIWTFQEYWKKINRIFIWNNCNINILYS